MLTPLDIQNKEFSRGFKGYKDVEVDAFLDQVINDYENLFKENLELKDKVSSLDDKIDHYSSIEGTLQKTLIMAQTSAEEVVKNAKDKAEMIVRDAEKEYSRKVDEANSELRKVRDEYENIKKEMMIYKSKCRAIISSQLRMMEDEFQEMSPPNVEELDKSKELEKIEGIIAEEMNTIEGVKDVTSTLNKESLEQVSGVIEEISKAEEDRAQ